MLRVLLTQLSDVLKSVQAQILAKPVRKRHRHPPRFSAGPPGCHKDDAQGGIGLDRGFYDSRRDGRAGGSDNIELLMTRYLRGEFDLVAVGRALLNEPGWTHKLRQGHELPAFDEARLKELH